MFARIPFSPIRESLYSPQELMAGLDAADYPFLRAHADFKCFAYYVRHGRAAPKDPLSSIYEVAARQLHHAGHSRFPQGPEESRRRHGRTRRAAGFADIRGRGANGARAFAQRVPHDERRRPWRYGSDASGRVAAK